MSEHTPSVEIVNPKPELIKIEDSSQAEQNQAHAQGTMLEYFIHNNNYIFSFSLKLKVLIIESNEITRENSIIHVIWLNICYIAH